MTFDINLSFGDIGDVDDFFDVALAADSLDGSIEALKAHKVILSASSPVLRSLLKKQSMLNTQSPGMPVMLYLRGISARGLGHVLKFVYKGSVSLARDDLNDFLAVCESLQVPLTERPKPRAPKAKRPTTSRDESERGKKVKVDPSLLTDNFSSAILAKQDPASAPIASPEPNEDTYYEGDFYLSDTGTSGTGTLEESLHVEGLMQSKIQACDGGFICLICGTSNKQHSSIRRHMREIHLDRRYRCPSCDKYFKNQRYMKNHVTINHKDWMVDVDYDSLVVKS